MAMAGLYRRLLSCPPAVEFASSQGKQLFLEAIQNGTMEGFYKLVSYFQTQSEPAFCGLASLSMVLNALAIDPGRKWKGNPPLICSLFSLPFFFFFSGPWRWFDESMLDCCEPLEMVKVRGISFGKLVCLAHCAGAEVEAFHASHSSIEDFRRYVIECSTSDDCHVISSYHRAALKQTGNGHFSPIGGYHVGKDMALILDVARFKYPPHWVPLTLLWEGMNYVDESTGQSRGFMLISRPHREPGMLYTLSCKHESWISIAKFLMDDVPLLLKSEDVKDIHQVLSIIVTSLPSNFEEFIKWVAEIRRREDGGPSLSAEEKARLVVKEEVLKQVQERGLFKHVSSFLSNSCSRQTPTSGDGDTLPVIAASVCCQGAEILGGKPSSSSGYCCQETCMKCWKAEDDKPITMVSGTYIRMHPASTDVLTVLLLSLPSTTWAGITNERLLTEIHSLVSIENLPTLLQEEVLHLRRQLHLLKRCEEGKVDEDLGSPLS
ncbi:glutathione gamma-glutamylcysteinyltransferase 1 isoform X2 [Abrus precatorius]|uniref:glutathione gamma-glutamylcysteinyltransferase n=1 Tax=Abrus precatorius TaxID=3816 RepID=A0A8B8LDL2_ABRPR|nr:glutathione gamma-glutamylcysteinyltransferase 1 isoform X2 [Abrus precatorius]